MYKAFLKRFIDIILSLIGIIVLFPVFLIVGIIIYIDDPGPVFFKQQRMGKDKKPFYLYKFRSMKIKTPQMPGYLMDNPKQYITNVGHVIRALSIDEFPQLFNILTGSMSIIGPRPALYENEDELNNLRDKYFIHTIKPGLTGWAQINGRDEISVKTKVMYDYEYYKSLTNGGFAAFSMDCKCFMGTILKVIRREGVIEGRIPSSSKEEKESVAI